MYVFLIKRFVQFLALAVSGRPALVHVTAYNNFGNKMRQEKIQSFDMEITMAVLVGRSSCIRWGITKFPGRTKLGILLLN